MQWSDGPWWTSGYARKRPGRSYFKQIKPILHIFRILGRFPYSMNSDGVEPFRMMSFPAIYTILYYIASSALSFMTAINLLGMLKESQNYDHSLQILMLMGYLIQNIIVPITFWQKLGQIVDYIAMWSKFESEYGKEFKQMSSQKWVIFSSIIFIPMGLIYCLRVFLTIGIEITHCSMLFIMIYASNMLSILWFTTLYEVRQQARKLGQIILREGLRKDPERKRNCWTRISLLASSLGDAIGLATGALLTSLFSSFLISCYGRLTSFMERINRDEYVWLELFESCLIFVFFFIMFDSAERTSIEVGNRFTSIVLNLKHSKMDKETLDDMSLLLSCVSICPPIVTFAGFVVVDRSLLTSSVSNTVTYVVMLFQYRRE